MIRHDMTESRNVHNLSGNEVIHSSSAILPAIKIRSDAQSTCLFYTIVLFLITAGLVNAGSLNARIGPLNCDMNHPNLDDALLPRRLPVPT